MSVILHTARSYDARTGVAQSATAAIAGIPATVNGAAMMTMISVARDAGGLACHAERRRLGVTS